MLPHVNVFELGMLIGHGGRTEASGGRGRGFCFSPFSITNFSISTTSTSSSSSSSIGSCVGGESFKHLLPADGQLELVKAVVTKLDLLSRPRALPPRVYKPLEGNAKEDAEDADGDQNAENESRWRQLKDKNESYKCFKDMTKRCRGR